MKRGISAIVLLVILTGVNSCISHKKAVTDSTAKESKRDSEIDKEFLGAGSTWAYPLYATLFSKYDKLNQTQTNYQSIGSGAGIKQITNRTVDFAASEVSISEKDTANTTAALVEFPTCMGAVTFTYNLPNNPKLKLTPEIVSGIFLRTIRKWNDAKIKAENPGTNLPDMDITVVRRSDGSIVTYFLTEYFSKINSDWKTKIGTGKIVNWPDSELSGKGNEGLEGIVKFTPGSIGYVDLQYALMNQLICASLKNASGNYVYPSLHTAGLSGNMEIPANAGVSLTNSSTDSAYSICYFSWIIIYKEQNYCTRTKEKAANLLKELWWMIHDGQQYTSTLNFAPLTPKAVEAGEAVLKSVTYSGQPMLQ